MKNIPLLGFHCHENPQLNHLYYRVMRISLFLLFFCAFSITAGNANSQNAKVSISQHNAPLEQILNEIESQTNYLFIYKNDVDVTVRKTLRISKKPVSEVLDVLLQGSHVTYTIEGNHIVLTNGSSTDTHPNRVTGIVTDEKGEP